MEEKIKIYLELIENTTEASKLLIASQVALDDGDLTLSQKYFLQVKDILNTLNGDTFDEVKELYSDPTDESEDYDISSLNLAQLLCVSAKTASTLLSIELDDQSNPTKSALENKLVKTLNACSELFGILFN